MNPVAILKCARRLLTGLLGLAAAALLLAACGGSSGRIDYDRWNHLYGDPDTGSADIGRPRCCRHATRSN
jgi:hypothetical protein